MQSLIDRQFIVVTGKGGVGRTAVSMAIATGCARAGRRTLLSTSAPRAQWPWFIPDAATGQIASVAPDLHVLLASPKAAREEYGLHILKNRALHKLVFSSRHVNNFLDAVPGLAEWAILGKATWHTLHSTEEPNRFDTVVLDAPATGHGLDMLRLPSAIVDSVPVGRIRDEAIERLTLLKDPQRCAVVPVTILEELPVNETIELVTALRESDFPVPFLVLNRMMSEALAPLSENTFAPLPSPVPDWARAIAVHDAAAKRQIEYRGQLAGALGLPDVALPECDGGIRSRVDLDRLVTALVMS